MIFPQNQEEIIINKNNCQILISFCRHTSRLSLEMRPINIPVIFAYTFAPVYYGLHPNLLRYFPTTLSLFDFLKGVNQDYLSIDDSNGKILILIYGQELQEKIIEIRLERQTEVALVRRIQELEKIQQEMKELLNIKKKEQDSELASLRESLEKMTLAYKDSMRLMTSQMEQLTHAFHKKQQKDFLINHKHSILYANQNRITNAAQDYAEVRWALIGPSISSQRNTIFKLKINKLSWLALGFCHKRYIEQRAYSRFNGSGPHGAYVMDDSGWIFSHEHPTSNYQRLGFTLKRGDEVLVISDPREATITFINTECWQRYDLSIRRPEEEMFPCIACSGETDIEIVDSQK